MRSLIFQPDHVSVTNLPWSEDRPVDSCALAVLLNNTAQDLRARDGRFRVERNHDAASIRFGYRHPRRVADAKHPPHPIQFLKSSTFIQIDEQIGAKPPGVFFRLAFLCNP